jgi:hypothetical protein
MMVIRVKLVILKQNLKKLNLKPIIVNGGYSG